MGGFALRWETWPQDIRAKQRRRVWVWMSKAGSAERWAVGMGQRLPRSGVGLFLSHVTLLAGSAWIVPCGLTPNHSGRVSGGGNWYVFACRSLPTPLEGRGSRRLAVECILWVVAGCLHLVHLGPQGVQSWKSIHG